MATRYTSYSYKNTTNVVQVKECAKNGAVKVSPGQTVTLYRPTAGSDKHASTIQDGDGDKLNLTANGRLRVTGTTKIAAGALVAIDGPVAVVQDAKDRTVTGTVAVSAVSGDVSTKPKAGETWPISAAATLATKPEKSAEQSMFHTGGVAKTLTGAYVAGDTIDLDSRYGVLHLFCQYTTGAAEDANSMQVIIEARRDGNASWHQLTNNDAALSLMEFSFTQVSAALSTDYFTIAVPIGPCDDVRVSAKETGVVANFGTLLVVGALGW